jgi:hypothetical protein
MVNTTNVMHRARRTRTAKRKARRIDLRLWLLRLAAQVMQHMYWNRVEICRFIGIGVMVSIISAVVTILVLT